MLYAIINPSDAYTFIGANDLVAGLAVLILGEGQYGCARINPDDYNEETQVLPIMIFGEPDNITAWVLEHSDYPSFEAAMENNLWQVASALDSVVIGDANDRALYQSARAKMSETDQATYAEEWHDKKRSSLNDIHKSARAISTALNERVSAAK